MSGEGTKGTIGWAYAEIGPRTPRRVCDLCVPQEKIDGKFRGPSPKLLGVLNPRRNTLARVKCSSKHKL